MAHDVKANEEQYQVCLGSKICTLPSPDLQIYNKTPELSLSSL